MSESAQAALVAFTNNGDAPLKVTVVIGDSEHEVAVLKPGESIRQVTPGHVEWCFATEGGSAAKNETVDGGLSEPDDDDDGKGGGKLHG